MAAATVNVIVANRRYHCSRSIMAKRGYRGHRAAPGRRGGAM